MMKIKPLICILLVTGFFVDVNATTNYKQSCVNKFLKLFSTFFSSAQVGGYADAGMAQVIVKANSSKIVDAVINAAWNNLTSSQYSKGSTLLLSAVSKFGGSYSAINSTIQKCINGAAPVLLKLYPEVYAKIKAKSGDAAKMNAGYKYADGKFKLKLCKKLVNKCKSQLTDSEWSKGTSILKGYINFEKLGYSV